MKITTQELKFSEYNHSLFLKNKEIEFDESSVICLLITQKDNVTKNTVSFDNVDIKKIKDKLIISYKDFRLFFNDGKYINFTIYDNNELNHVMKKFKKLTNVTRPIMFDNFLEHSPLVFNSENYCYISKEMIEKTAIRNGHKDLGDETYAESNIPDLILAQEVEGCINFKILELDLGIRKIKLNMYMKKTLEYNEINAPGLISVKQKIKRML